jgi:hypothetical protein
MAMRKISISVPADVVEAARAEAGDEGLSAFVTKSLRRQLAEKQRPAAMDAYLDEMDARYGPLDEAEIQEAMERLKG